MERQIFACRLKGLRKVKGITQKELGLLVGIRSGSAGSRINHYEKGRHIPKINDLVKISNVLNVPLSYFFCEDKELAELVIVLAKLNSKEKGELLKSLNNESQTSSV